MLVHFLRDENAEFYTFQLKEDKPLRVVICNLHLSTPTDLIKSELEARLYEVRQVTQVPHRLNKNVVPLFFVDMEPTPYSKLIFQITFLLHTKIKVDEPYKSKTIARCANC